jgi:hypothetical protein
MPSVEVEEFARLLVTHVRDAAVRSCDANLDPQGKGPVARRWREVAASPSELRVMIPDAIDEAVGALLQAIDQGVFRLKFVGSSGREVDLCEEGAGELCGWYMGSGGWRAMFAEERFVDDFADMMK